MTAETTHPLADAYLRDLELLLHGIEPGERAEVLAGVREHLEAGAGAGATDAEVRAALAELGPPQAIADEAYAGRPATVLVAAPAPAAPRRPALSGTWVPAVVGVLLGLCVVWTLLTSGLRPAYTGSSVNGGPEVVDAYALHPLEVLVLALLGGFWLLLPCSVLVLASQLWRRGEKARLVVLTPAIGVVLGVLPWVGWLITRSPAGVTTGAVLGLVLSLAAAARVFWHDLRAGARRARALP
ncbi:hypothetical protein ACFUC1_06350 [Pedococcus sp. NPDC057267]|uniref:HAAS signaling domain-containing protein n=1 Tax=Pedococcus sp. NPDC057267 TaxID=3346077 RepID=UPI003644FC14